MTRVWTCRKCKEANPRIKQKCWWCGTKRPAARRPAHALVLDQPYEWWVDQFGEQCGICGTQPVTKRLDRDHDHKTGHARGLLCHRCNRALPNWMTASWLENALVYLRRTAPVTKEPT